MTATLEGKRPDPLRAILERKVRLQGDLQRLVKHAGRHQGAGLEAVRAGAGAAAVIRGEAGIGKTRLATELRQRAGES